MGRQESFHEANLRAEHLVRTGLEHYDRGNNLIECGQIVEAAEYFIKFAEACKTYFELCNERGFETLWTDRFESYLEQTREFSRKLNLFRKISPMLDTIFSSYEYVTVEDLTKVIPNCQSADGAWILQMAERADIITRFPVHGRKKGIPFFKLNPGSSFSQWLEGDNFR